MKSYGKINLTLDVLGKREDGYHEIKSLFQRISLYDDVDIREKQSGGISILCNRSDLPLGKENLVWKAAVAFWDYQNRPHQNIEIALWKRIPSCAGLGGGSSNAAAVLSLLNEMEENPLSIEELSEIAVAIGADVPFFLLGGTALGEGVGEKLTPLTPLELCHIVIVKPDFPLSTPKIFQAVDEVDVLETGFTEKVLQAIQKRENISPYLGNVLEKGLGKERKEIDTIKEELKKLGAENASMTGSGSAVFGIFGTEETALSACESLKEKYTEIFYCVPV